jgi:hypothetical protein
MLIPGRADLTTKPRIAGPAALLQCCSVGYPKAYSLAGVTLFLTLFLTAICCPGHRYGTFALPPRRNEGSSRVRGRALLSFRLEPVVRQRSLLSLQIETCAPFNSCLARCPISLDSCLRTLSRYCRSRTLTWSRLRVILWIVFKTGPGQEHSSRQVRSFEVSAKASAQLA